MPKVLKPLHQYDYEGGGTFPREMQDGMRDHTDISGVPYMPAKGLYYPGADIPMTPGLPYKTIEVVIPEPPDYREYLVKDISRIPETFVPDSELTPLVIVTTALNLPELSNLLSMDYGLGFDVLMQPKAFQILSSLKNLARSLRS